MMKSRLIQFYRTVFLGALLCMVTVLNVNASHLVAIDMNVKYIGAGQDGCSGTTEYKYRITLVVYSACEQNSSSTIGTTAAIRIWSDTYTGNPALIPQPTLPLVTVNAPNPDIVDQLCAAYKNQNSCYQVTNQQWPGFREWRYEGDVILPSPQTDWRFSYFNGARNNGITNLDPSSKGNIYVECMLNNVVKYNNSTPFFKKFPVPYICQNVLTGYLNLPTDADKDSLVTYQQPSINSSPSTGVYNYDTYLAPTYSLQNPIGSTTGYVVDSSTGTAYFTPQNQGKYVLAFRCDAYQPGSGVLTGYIMRDVQVQVFPCTAPAPSVDSIPQNVKNAVVVENCYTGRGTFVYVCPGSTMSMDISAATDAAHPNNNVYMKSDFTGTGASFTVAGDGTSKPVATFSWAPTINDYGEWTLTVTSSDSTCDPNQPIVLPTNNVYSIKVVKGLDAGPDRGICEFNSEPQQLFVKGADCLNVTWTNLDGSFASGLNKINTINPIDTLLKPVRSHSFIVSTTNLAGQCKNSDTVAIFLDETNSVKTYPENPVILCRPDYLQMDAVTTGKPPLANLVCGIANPLKCVVPDTLAIKGSAAFGADLYYDTLGTATPTFPNFQTKSSKMQYLISSDDLWTSGFRAATINSISFEVIKNLEFNHPYENFTISMGCSPTVDQLSKSKGFEKNMVPVFTSATPITFAPGKYKFDLTTPYSWDTTTSLIIQICYSNSTEITACTDPGGTAPILRFVQTDYVSALSLKGAQTTVSVCDSFVNPNIKATQARPLFGFTFCEANNNPFTYRWTPGNMLSDSTIAQPLAYVDKSITYAFESYGRNGCIIRDSVKIYVPDNNYTVTPADTAICFGETAPLHIKGGFTYKWYSYKDGEYTLLTDKSNCWECADPILRPDVTTTYKIVVYDSVWCTDTLTARVEVMPLPDVRILNRDTIVKYGQGLQLLVGGARQYNWLNPASLSNTTISNPIARPTEPTDYVVGGIGRNGCRAFDTVKVDVDYRDNLFIPSAFSPNGDGKNDVFKITNLSFQRVMEFRVFNRWGQEVFYSNDNTHGWDGNWKGVPQDLGSYQYFIRLGYPDGLVETYKGEVTLVR